MTRRRTLDWLDERREPIGRTIFNATCVVIVLLFVVQSVLLDFPDAPRIVGAWMWWLLVPLLGGLIFAESDR